MHKINTSTATSDNGFTDGDFATGVSPTQLDADWFNAVQGELTNLVEGWNGTIGEADKEGGNYVLSQTSNNQILKIIHEKLSDLRTELQTQITANVDNLQEEMITSQINLQNQITANTDNLRDYAEEMTTSRTNLQNQITTNANNLQNYKTGLVGTIIYAATRGNVPGYLKLDGTKYEVADYPELARWAFDNSRKRVDSNYLNNPRGYFEYFIFSNSNFDSNTHFRMPNFRGLFLRVLDEGGGLDPDHPRTLMTLQDDRIRNITGHVKHIAETFAHYVTTQYSSGALYKAHNQNQSAATPARTDSSQAGSLYFNASRVVPTGADNRPKNVSVCAYIKY